MPDEICPIEVLYAIDVIKLYGNWFSYLFFSELFWCIVNFDNWNWFRILWLNIELKIYKQTTWLYFSRLHKSWV